MNNYERWKEKYATAKDNMKKALLNEGILIEVAAQHPLIDGKYPNEEFQKRLDLAIELYNKLKLETSCVKIYVPGSLHQENNVADLISLSTVGFNYLVKNKISIDDIYSDDANIRYKKEQGVYNSSDECFVASKLFFDNSFKEIHSVCSSAQLMRKVLSYIEFGVVPFMHSVSTFNMYHNYIDEFFINIPILIEDNNGLQGESKEAERLRKIRNPNLKI